MLHVGSSYRYARVRNVIEYCSLKALLRTNNYGILSILDTFVCSELT
jgi:hypothetical protein